MSIDRKVLSGIIYVLKNGLRWCDVLKEYKPRKTLYNRFMRWNKKGIFKISSNFYPKCKILPNSCKSTRLILKHIERRCLNPKRDENHRIGKTLLIELTGKNISDYTVSTQIITYLTNSKVLLSDKVYDSNKFDNALKFKDIKPYILGKNTGNYL